jgi:CHAT domain-containing protein
MNFISSINQFPSESFKKEDYVEFIYRANDLFQTLLNPVFQAKDMKKIIVIPDNILGYLPFEVLIDNYEVPSKIDFKNLNYLIKSYNISYAYSSTLLYKHFTWNKINSRLLAVAPTYQNRDIGNGSESFAGERNMVDNLKSLAYSLDEVNNIISILKGKILSGDEATENNFKKNASNFGILHLAMHTLINDTDPLASKLVFTLVNDTIEDGFLNAYEVYNLKLNAALAVLSACKTGSGKFSRGEGIMSIARGFLYAGVRSVVMTLWEVEDASGSEIMYHFYKNLKTGAETDIALKDAKLAYLETADPLQSHPYFWAAYVQIGKTDPILNNTRGRIIIVAISIIAIVLIGLYLRKYYRRKGSKFS